MVKLDNEYIRNWNFGMDVKILLKTFGVVFKGDGAK
ncbi:MAG: sugar transferase [Marvinbryantia sp.]